MIDDVDCTIVGAGIVGLSTAIEIKERDPSLKVLVLDKKSLPIGASTRNAGFACFGSVSEIINDIERFGERTAAQLIAMRWRGLSLLRQRIPAGDMDYRHLPGKEIFEKEHAKSYTQHLDFINEFVGDILEEKDCFSVVDGRFGPEVVNRLEGALNPQKMMAFLELRACTLGVVLVQGIDVTDIDQEKHELTTDLGSLGYKKLIVCTNGFSSKLLPEMDVQPARNQVIMTSKVPGFSLDGCYHMHKGFVYFREINSRLLLGGGRHLDMSGETTQELANTAPIINYLEVLAREVILPGKPVEIERKWSGILGVGDSKMPIVKNLSDHVLIAVRMGGMGVAVGSYIGRVIASIFMEEDNSDTRLFVSE